MGLPLRVMRVLDVFLVVLCVSGLLSALFSFRTAPQSAMVVVSAVAAALALVCWAAWRRGGSDRWVLALFVALVLTGSTGDGVSLLVSLVVSLALLTAVFGVRAGLLGIAVVLVYLTAMMLQMWDQPLAAVVTQVLFSIPMALMGVLLGQVLRELASERRENARLLAEVRSRAAAQKELVLADERARSARELHDGLGHRLTVIGMSLEFAERMRERDPEQAFAEVAQARSQATEALEYMRRWVRALNPPREANLAGMAAFDAIAESFRGTGLAVQVHGEGDERPLSQAASLFAYRLVQEGLTNVLRHSPADRVDITVHWLPGWVEIQVADNGLERGGSAMPAQVGFGLRSLTERARELGGSLSAGPGEQGMLLVGRVPDEQGVAA